MSVRVLTICGSLQRASANRPTLDVAKVSLRASGAEVDDYLDLAAVPPFNPRPTPGPFVTDLRRLRSSDRCRSTCGSSCGAAIRLRT